MMSQEEKVVVHGMWASPYVKRVEIALKLKGIPYEYVEEDILNLINGKSESLLKHNPVHQKVPVLVHNGKPVIDSFIIVEYIDETWKSSGHPLLPQDPYSRAKVRFWADFIQRQLFEKFLVTITAVGEAREEAIKEVGKNMEVLEEELRASLFPEGIVPANHFSDLQNVGFLDIAMCSCFGHHEAQSEFVGGTDKIIDRERTPLVFSWVEALKEVPLVKEVLPSHDGVVNLFWDFRQNGIGSSRRV